MEKQLFKTVRTFDGLRQAKHHVLSKFTENITNDDIGEGLHVNHLKCFVVSNVTRFTVLFENIFSMGIDLPQLSIKISLYTF